MVSAAVETERHSWESSHRHGTPSPTQSFTSAFKYPSFKDFPPFGARRWDHLVGKRREYVEGMFFPPFTLAGRGLWTVERQSLFKCKEAEKWLGSSVLGRMGTAWGSAMWTPTLAYWCLSNCNKIVPSPFLLADFMCFRINIKFYNLVWMSAVDEKQIPAGTARTLHPGCVCGTWVELCGRDSAEFVA